MSATGCVILLVRVGVQGVVAGGVYNGRKGGGGVFIESLLPCFGNCGITRGLRKGRQRGGEESGRICRNERKRGGRGEERRVGGYAGMWKGAGDK
eukprot:759900-Hanusia_phi.AAC.3